MVASKSFPTLTQRREVKVGADEIRKGGVTEPSDKIEPIDILFIWRNNQSKKLLNLIEKVYSPVLDLKHLLK